MITKILFAVFTVVLSACGTLDKKTLLINAGDTKKQVVEIMGAPKDRQFRANQEAWQYCVSGAGFGYNDHKIIWFKDGIVTGLNTYRTSNTGCSSGIKAVEWEQAPDFIFEKRTR
jgi:hypothetical protein